jgi:hypothetical protein
MFRVLHHVNCVYFKFHVSITQAGYVRNLKRTVQCLSCSEVHALACSACTFYRGSFPDGVNPRQFLGNLINK